MSSEYEIHAIQNINLENPDNLIHFRQFDHNNLLEFTDKLIIYPDCEFYILVTKGELSAIIHEDCISIKENEIVMVKPGYKTGFKFYQTGRNIEFYTLTTPSSNRPININTRFHIIAPYNFEDPRELNRQWGVRIPYKMEKFQQKWLFGYGNVHFNSGHVSWVSVIFANEDNANKIFSKEYYHLHSKSYEYYVCLEGKDIILVNSKLTTVSKGEVLVIPPGVCHRRLQFEYPYDGFVFRVPLISENDKNICESITIRLIEDHLGEEADILYLDKGDEVIPQDRKTHYEGWIYCEKEGKYGWVPENYMELQSNDNFIMKNYYFSYELEGSKGDRFETLIEESEWYLVRNEKGKVGWIPMDKTN